jgi:hypothetical protein
LGDLLAAIHVPAFGGSIELRVARSYTSH